jgi:hypothetical protein
MRSARKKRLHDKRKLSEERTKRKWVRPVIHPYAIPGADLVLGLNKLFANIDKAGDAPDEYVAEIARVQFERVFRDCFVRLLQLAECEHDTIAKQWAAALLAWFDGNLGKHRGKLAKVNPAYREAAKIGIRADVALPKSPVGQILQEELRAAERYRFELVVLRELFKEQKDLLLISVDKEAVERRLQGEAVLAHLAAGFSALWTRKGIREIKKCAREGAAAPTRIYPDEVTSSGPYTWKEAARERGIPEEYWPLADFPELSLDPDAADALELFQESSKKWWAFIWSRIKQKQDTLLPRLRDHAKGRAAAKNQGVLYLKHFQKEYQNHWQTLVRERMVGTF